MASHFSSSGRRLLQSPPEQEASAAGSGPAHTPYDAGEEGNDPETAMHSPAERPADEARRVDALLAQGILDTPADEELDDLVEIGRRTLGTAACAINFVDSDRQWTKAACGLTTKEIHRDWGLCAHTILHAQRGSSSFRGALPNDLFVVLDAAEDARFKPVKMTQEEGTVRFYAGHALCVVRRGQRYAIGTFCVMDPAPRTEFSGYDASLLAVLAEAVKSKLEATSRPMASGPLASPWQDGGIDERVKILVRCAAVTTRSVAVSALKSLAEVLRPRVYQAESYITRRGEPGDSMFFVVMGQVAVRIKGQTLETHGPRQSFGEIALVNIIEMCSAGKSAEEARSRWVRGADIVALERCELLELHAEDARELIRVAPNLWFTLQEMAHHRQARQEKMANSSWAEDAVERSCS